MGGVFFLMFIISEAEVSPPPKCPDSAGRMSIYGSNKQFIVNMLFLFNLHFKCTLSNLETLRKIGSFADKQHFYNRDTQTTLDTLNTFIQ